MDNCGVDVFNSRYCSWQLVGVLRIRLGWLVVLGPGRKRILYALAGWDGTDTFSVRYRETRQLQELDGAACDIHFFTQPARYLSGSFRRTDFSARFCHRSRAWCVYSGLAGINHWSKSGTVCLACAQGGNWWPL